MTKREALKRPSLKGMFEDILQGDLFQDSGDWRECKYFRHVSWIAPLLKDGRIEEAETHPAWPDGVPDGTDRKPFNYHKVNATPKGIAWWIHENAEEVPDRPAAYKTLIEDFGGRPSQLEGKGIGAELIYCLFWGQATIATAAIEDGYFEFVGFYNRSYDPTGGHIVVRLTATGMKYFDSIPRLVLVCA